jgi:hypothetical protein
LEIVMKTIAALLVGAAALAYAGAALVGVARLERHLAEAQEQQATQQYAAAERSLEEAARYAGRARWVPLLGSDARREIAVRTASLQYWQRRWDAVLPPRAEPVAAVDETNAELQLVVANALHRRGQAQARDRAAVLQALEQAAGGYLTVLKNDTWLEDAAYNYELVVRLRDEAARGRSPAPGSPPQNSDLGEGGAPTPETSQKGFEIYVPLESDEKTPSGGEAGKAGPKQRKG